MKLSSFAKILLALLQTGKDNDGAGDTPGPCCYPPQMSGDVYTAGSLRKDWGGRMLTDWVFYDLGNGTKFKTSKAGSCTVFDIDNPDNFARCTPEDAVAEKGNNSIIYRYNTGEVSVVKKVEEGSCLPLEITKSTSGGPSLKQEYRAVCSHRQHHGHVRLPARPFSLCSS